MSRNEQAAVKLRNNRQITFEITDNLTSSGHNITFNNGQNIYIMNQAVNTLYNIKK